MLAYLLCVQEVLFVFLIATHHWRMDKTSWTHTVIGFFLPYKCFYRMKFIFLICYWYLYIKKNNAYMIFSLHISAYYQLLYLGRKNICRYMYHILSKTDSDHFWINFILKNVIFILYNFTNVYFNQIYYISKKCQHQTDSNGHTICPRGSYPSVKLLYKMGNYTSWTYSTYIGLTRSDGQSGT